MEENTPPAPPPQPPSPLVPPPARPRVEIKKPPIIWESTQKLLTSIASILGGNVMSYFIPNAWIISQDDVKYFYSHLKKVGHQQKLYFILVSNGGDGMGSWRIASLLKDFCDELVIVLPEKAASAATMLSLAADELIMTPLAYLTAVDTSITHPLNPKDPRNNPISIELEQVKRAVDMIAQNKEGSNVSEAYKSIFNYIHPVALGSIERSKNLSEMICSDILSLRRKSPFDEESKSRIISRLNTGYPAHGYPIPRHKARELGLNITDSSGELNDLLWELLNTYRYLSEPVRTDITDTFVHTEQVGKIIESVGSRFFLNSILEKKLDPTGKGWTTFRDELKWVSCFEKEEDGKKVVKISYLEF